MKEKHTKEGYAGGNEGRTRTNEEHERILVCGAEVVISMIGGSGIGIGSLECDYVAVFCGNGIGIDGGGIHGNPFSG